MGLQQALVGRDPGEPQPRRRGGRARHGQRVGDAAHPAAPARVAGLEQDVEGPGRRVRRDPRGEPLDPRDRVDVAADREALVGAQLGEDGVDVGAADELVGDQDPRHPGGVRDARLLRVGRRDAPAAVLELAAEELGDHRGLAVRAEDDLGAARRAERVEERRERAGVRAQGRVAQRAERERQLLVQDPGAAGGGGVGHRAIIGDEAGVRRAVAHNGTHVDRDHRSRPEPRDGRRPALRPRGLRRRARLAHAGQARRPRGDARGRGRHRGGRRRGHP